MYIYIYIYIYIHPYTSKQANKQTSKHANKHTWSKQTSKEATTHTNTQAHTQTHEHTHIMCMCLCSNRFFLEPPQILLVFVSCFQATPTQPWGFFLQNDGMDLALCHSCDQVFDCTVLSITSLVVFWTLVSCNHDGEDI